MNALREHTYMSLFVDLKLGSDYRRLPSQSYNDCDVVIHLANYKYDDNPWKLVEDCCGMDRLLKNLDPKVKFIYASSSAVYDEEHMMNPPTKYGLSKLIQENKLLGWGNPTILRLFNVYGEGSDSGVIYEFQKKILNDEWIDLNDGGIPTRDFIHVSDVVDVIIREIETPNFSNIIEVGTGVKTSIYTLANMMYEITGKDKMRRFTSNSSGVHESVSHGPNFGKLPLRENLKKLLIKTEI